MLIQANSTKVFKIKKKEKEVVNPLFSIEDKDKNQIHIKLLKEINSFFLEQSSMISLRIKVIKCDQYLLKSID